jgi:hypothetical protein
MGEYGLLQLLPARRTVLIVLIVSECGMNPAEYGATYQHRRQYA